MVVAAGVNGDGTVTLRPQDPTSFNITKEGRVFVVHGKRVERMAAMTNTETEEGLARLEKHMRKLGVFDALEKAGVQPGDTVRFGPVELGWGEG
jgi:GTP-binding protein